MSQTRYFQHLNPQDPDFQKITELKNIDNSDPTFVLYYFKDGSKCNKDFIGKLNEQDVYGKREFVEVSGPYNAWEFEVQNVKREKKFATNANGERVEIADIMDRCDNPHQDGKRVVIKKKPEYVDPSIIENKQQFNFNDATTNSITTSVDETKNNKEKQELNEITTNKVYDVDNNPEEIITYCINGNTVSMSIKELIDLANKEPEEKIVEKIVEKKIIVDNPDVIDINLDDNQKGLIENMIDMSQKETCDIDMEITLSLPPASVYQLIKSVYPSGMAESFVNIIANRMNIKELKTKVAQGLLAYYDADSNVDIVTDSSK